ncbi:hypothetical protein BZM27_52260 [Paraburkholderia steynii]|uniref:Acyl-CoA dehydrogenase C-terminal domain-containing protein n=1 Tax=Paraburkholderia steynii TaxID=1245441 RepID=A0A4R0WYZ9_9BURK|nr:hypothetical protein BZM27_52260 [Paraburkholderia steynii]
MTPIHGIARGAYEEFVSYIRDKVAIIGVKNTVDYLDVQAAIGESKAEIDLAHLLTQKLSAMGMKDGAITIDDVVDVRRDFLMVQKLLKSAIDRLLH